MAEVLDIKRGLGSQDWQQQQVDIKVLTYNSEPQKSLELLIHKMRQFNEAGFRDDEAYDGLANELIKLSERVK